MHFREIQTRIVGVEGNHVDNLTTTTAKLVLKWPFPASLSLFCLFNPFDIKQMFDKSLLMTGFEPGISTRRQPLYQLNHNHCPLYKLLPLSGFLFKMKSVADGGVGVVVIDSRTSILTKEQPEETKTQENGKDGKIG